MSPERPAPTFLRLGSLLFVLLGLGWWWLTRTHAGSWWWAAVLSFLPAQVLLLWPALLIYRAWHARKPGWLVFNLLSALVFTVAVAGFVLPRARPAPSGTPLTLLSLNANYAQASPEKLAEIALQEGAQVITLQEGLDKEHQAGPFETRIRAAFPGWTVVRHDELLTLSRLPVLRRQILTFPHSPHSLLLVQVRVDGQPLDIINTHLPTLALLPGASDQALSDRAPSDRTLGRTLPGRIGHTLDIRRDFQGVVGRLARQDDTDHTPLLLAGDLNAPPRGGLSYQLRSVGWQDAFAAAGWGFGFTHHALLPHSRIDYVWLHGPHAESARPLLEPLSDHRALLVRVRLPQ